MAAQVAIGENADQPAIVAHYTHRAKARLRHLHHGIQHLVVRLYHRVLVADDVAHVHGHQARMLIKLLRTHRREIIFGQGFQYFPRHGNRVAAHFNGVAHVFGVAYRREHDFGIRAVIANHFHAFADQFQRVVALVLHPAGQHAHVSGSGGHGHVGLLDGVHQMHIYHHAPVAEHLAGFHTFQRNGNLEHRFGRVKAEFQLAFGIAHDFLGSGTEGFNLQHRNYFGQLHDHAIQVGHAFAVHECGRGGQSGQKAHFECAFNFFEVGRIKV